MSLVEVGKVFFLLVVHASLFMFIWSFAKTILTDPGRVPLHWVIIFYLLKIKKTKGILFE